MPGESNPHGLAPTRFEACARGRSRVSIGHDRRHHGDVGAFGEGRRARWSPFPLDGSGTEVTQTALPSDEVVSREGIEPSTY
jgi:hypothetical protein